VSNLIIDPNGAGLKHAHDPYWDAPITRREVQQAVNDISMNENALQNMCDTSNIVLNFLCEKMNVTRGELDAYVAKKKAEIEAFLEEQKKKAAEGENNAQSNR